MGYKKCIESFGRKLSNKMGLEELTLMCHDDFKIDLIVLSLPAGKTPFEVQINSNDKNTRKLKLNL